MYGYTDVSSAFRIKSIYTAFTEIIDSDYFFVGEQHNFWELVIVLDGEIGITAGEKTDVLCGGQAYLHSPMEFHRVWYAGNIPGQILVFSFGGDGVPNGASGQYAADPATACALLTEMEGTYAMEGINVVGTKEPQLRGQLLLKRLELFILELLSEKGESRETIRSRSAENYARLVRFLEGNVHRNLSVDEIALQCNMSTINAKQTFSKYAGLGIRTYFNRLKIEAAIPMLQQGASVQETAAALGFSSQNYFSTVFKRIMGKPPMAYK